MKLSMKRVLQTWWPLAGSWLLMALELPALSAVVARLQDPQINLAAWGGVVFPLALIIEAPIIMLLAASTALSEDWDSYRKLRRFMMWAGGALTALHVLVAFTSLFDVVVLRFIGAPVEILEPARIGMRIMIPWTWAIAYRRFNQGVLIRFGHAKGVGEGTVVRLGSNLVILILGLYFRSYRGIVVAATAVATGVTCEAIYAGLRARPIVRDQVKHAPPVDQPLTRSSFLDFYVPLAMTSLLFLLVQPIGSAALSRMPAALASLAAWPVVSGLVFLLRSPGMAFNEVVVALLGEPQAMVALRRFTLVLISITTFLLILAAGTPLSVLWFERFSALAPELADLARRALWFAIPLPALNVLQSLYQGTIMYSRRTRGITEAVVLALITISLILIVGVASQWTTGLFVGWIAFSVGTALQVVWLRMRSHAAIRSMDSLIEARSG